jgi:tRNA-dihydrouridine synthase A
MLDWTDRHCRYFHRLISKNALLYTEMVTTGAILHGDSSRFLALNEAEHPVAFQLGGSHPQQLAKCAKLIEEQGFDQINLNVGCPSDRVQNGMFGACLMAHPQVVADCVAAMQAAVAIPVTVKTRIGIDQMESYEEFKQFVVKVLASGCKTFIVHARKAWLQGLSPKENRDIPPLRYDYVYRLKQELPELEVVINGGLDNLKTAKAQLEHVDGVMLGRAVYHQPYLLSEVDRLFYGDNHPIKTRQEIIEELIPYIQQQLAQGLRLNHISRHILGLFHGQKGAKQWRRYISENAHKPGADEQVITDALEFTR